MTRRPLFVSALLSLLALSGCTVASAPGPDEPALVGAAADFRDALSAIEGVSDAEISIAVARAVAELRVDPSATSADAIAAGVADAIAASDFSRAAINVSFATDTGADFEWFGYDPAQHDRYVAALDLWWSTVDDSARVGAPSGFVNHDWFGFGLRASAEALLAGEVTVAPLGAVRAAAEDAGLTILESQFAVTFPSGRDRYFELDADAFDHIPSTSDDLLDDVVDSPGIAVYLVGLGMDAIDDDVSPAEHEIPTEIYIIPTELPGGGYPPLDLAFAQTALDALDVESYRAAVSGGARIDGIFLLTDTGLVRVSG